MWAINQNDNFEQNLGSDQNYLKKKSEIFSPIRSGHCKHVQTEFSSLKGWVSKR